MNVKKMDELYIRIPVFVWSSYELFLIYFLVHERKSAGLQLVNEIYLCLIFVHSSPLHATHRVQYNKVSGLLQYGLNLFRGRQ